MNFALPIVTSDRVGAAEDLVRDGDNGFRYAVGDVEALASRLDAIVGRDGVATRMGARSLARIQDYSIERTVEGVEAGLDAVVGAERHREREGVS
jgi:glycosyltransferase involved in cell wall biosynthesis